MSEIVKATTKLQSKDRIYNFNGKQYRVLTSKRNAFICKYFDNFYLISSAHDITSVSFDIIKLGDQKIILNKNNKILLPEIDLVIYKLCNSDITDYIDIKNNKYAINDLNEKTPLYFIDREMNIQSINIHFMDKTKYNNACYPDMLKYFAKSEFKDLQGCSGSPIFDDENNIFGILSGHGNKYINVTPFFFVRRILDEVQHYGSFSGLCNFWHDTNIVKRNLVISKREDIDYNLYQKVSEKKTAKLIKDDIVLRFDDKNVINGMIFSDLLNMEIDIDSYISITKTIHSLNYLHIFRPKNLRQKFINIIIGNRDIYSAYNIDIKDDILTIKEIKNKIYVKINPKLFNYISEFRPVHLDMKLMDLFKLKQSEMFENSYLLVEDKAINKNIFNNIHESYISIKM